MGPRAVEHSGRAKHDVTPECSGESDQVGAAKHVPDGNGEAATVLLLLLRALMCRKAPCRRSRGRWELR